MINAWISSEPGRVTRTGVSIAPSNGSWVQSEGVIQNHVGDEFGGDQQNRKAGNGNLNDFLSFFLRSAGAGSAIGMRAGRAKPEHGERYKG